MTPLIIDKMFRHAVFFLTIVMLMGGCSSKNEATPPDKLIWLLRRPYNSGLILLQKVNDVAYNPKSNAIISAFEPAMPGQANIIKLSYNKNNGQKDPIRFDLANITSGPIRHIKISSDGEYTVFSGRTRELIALKNELPYEKFNLPDEVTRIEFNEMDKNILAVGDQRGKLTIIDLGKPAILNTVQLFDDAVTGLAFFKDNQLLVSGNDSRLFQIDVRTGKIVRTIETNGLKEKMYHATGIKHCFKDRINRVLYIESEDKIITAHGWDYCHDFRIKVWDASSGNLIKEIAQLKHPVYYVVWMSKLRSLVFVDHGQNLFRLSLSDLSLSTPKYLPETMTTYHRLPEKDDEIKINFGNILSLTSIPGTNYLLMGMGSYFRGGPGALLIELTTTSIKNIARMKLGSDGNAQLLVHEELFSEIPPPRS